MGRVTLIFIFALSTERAHSEPVVIEELIRVNQIGYLTDGNKVAVLADPQEGFNADETFVLGASYELRRWNDDVAVFSDAPTVWNGGATHSQSGDRGWWFDFSEVTTPGSYYVWDVENEVGSYGFEIGDRVYADVLKAAVRMFFYQRCGFEKSAAYAGTEWADGAAFLHEGQDTEARSVYDRENPASARDLRGGWMDAGDYNKYVTFAAAPVHQLLSAYEERPEIWGDDYGIPESGNGIPDLLDEIHFEMRWVSRMQEPDGGVLLKMGEVDHNGASPPSEDRRPRYYVPSCSSSTIAAAGMYAHAALVFQAFDPWSEYAVELEQQALLAWNWYHQNEKQTDCDDGTVKAGDADWDLARQHSMSVVAAMYLHRLTGDSEFGKYVADEYNNLDPKPFQWAGWYAAYHPIILESLLSYVDSGFAHAWIASAVRSGYLSLEDSSEGEFSWSEESDLYRSYSNTSRYHWGSNNIRSRLGIAVMGFESFGYDEADLPERRLQGENMLHYFLGVNPLGMVYLTNMGAFGAERSAQQIYHTWFAEGSNWDANPAPGYLPGGPNKDYAPDGGTWDEINASLQGAPPQKAYADFNHGWPWNSWEVTEPAIYYQSAFVKFLSKFVSKSAAVVDYGDDDGDGMANGLEDWLGTNRDSFDSLGGRYWMKSSDGIWELEFLTTSDSPAGTFVVEASEDLVDWDWFFLGDAEIVEQLEGLVRRRLALVEAGERVFIRFGLLGSPE